MNALDYGEPHESMRHRRRWIKAVRGGCIVWLLSYTMLRILMGLLLPEITDPGPGMPPNPAGNCLALRCG